VTELEKKRTALQARLNIPGVQSVRNKVLKKASGDNSKVAVEDEKTLQKLRNSIEKEKKKREANALNHAYRLAGRYLIFHHSPL